MTAVVSRRVCLASSGRYAVPERTTTSRSEAEAVTLDAKFSIDPKTKKIKKGTLSLKTTITRMHWAGPAKKKPDKADMDAIKEIESLNTAHEQAYHTGPHKF